MQTIIKTQQDMQAVPQFWADSGANGSIEKIKQVAQVTPETLIHAALYECTDEQYTYLLCMPVPESGCPQDFVKLTIPAGEWAVFMTPDQTYEEMSQIAANIWKQIFTEWFVMSGYELAQALEMEMHYHTSSDKCKAEIWIPVIKK